MKRGVHLLGTLTLIAGSLHCGGSTTTDSGSGSAASAAQTAKAPSNWCGLLTEREVAEAVGNPVRKGFNPDIAAPDCKWEVDIQDDISVLLIVYRPGSIHEQGLCPDIRKSGKASGFEGIGDASTWEFSNVAGLFNSGLLQSCGPTGYISTQLNGKRDEARLKQATVALMGKILPRL
jgi:hypothetical protein